MKIFLVRHGQTGWNKESRWQGNMDIELNEDGILQAERLARRLSGSGIEYIYSSPLLRARVTAEIINKELNVPISFVDALKEIRLGPWEGYTNKEIKAEYAELFSTWENEPEKEIGLGIESYKQLLDRAGQAVSEICDKHSPHDTIAIISHGAWIRALITFVMKIPLEHRMCFDIDNTSVSIIEYNREKNKFKACTLNDHAHL